MLALALLANKKTWAFGVGVLLVAFFARKELARMIKEMVGDAVVGGVGQLADNVVESGEAVVDIVALSLREGGQLTPGTGDRIGWMIENNQAFYDESGALQITAAGELYAQKLRDGSIKKPGWLV